MKALAGCAALLAAAIGLAGDPGPPGEAPVGGLDEAVRSRLAGRFEREVWPLMIGPADARKGCAGCHHDDGSNVSDFVLPDDPLDAFDALLDDGYFDEGNPNAVLARVARKGPEKRMPPEPAPSWSAAEVGRLRKFVEALSAARKAGDGPGR